MVPELLVTSFAEGRYGNRSLKTRGSQPFSLIEKNPTVPVAIWYRIIATNKMVMFLRVKIDLTCGGGGGI